MTSYQDISFTVPLVGTFSPVIKALDGTIQGISTGLNVVSGLLQVMTPLLSLGEIPSLDVGAALRASMNSLVANVYDGELEAYHLYPESRHKIYTYRTFLRLAEKIITENPATFGTSKKLMVWLVKAPSQVALLPLVAPILSLFGLPPVEFEPLSITRDPLADYLPPAAISRPIDVIPGLRALADGLIQTGDSFSAPVDVSALASGAVSMLQRKAQLLSEKLSELSLAIATIEALASIAISKMVIDSQATPEAFVAELRAGDNAPGQTELVAGTIFAYDSTIAPLVESLL